MEHKKITYESPAVTVVDICLETAFLQASGDTVFGLNDLTKDDFYNNNIWEEI